MSCKHDKLDDLALGLSQCVICRQWICPDCSCGLVGICLECLDDLDELVPAVVDWDRVRIENSNPSPVTLIIGTGVFAVAGRGSRVFELKADEGVLTPAAVLDNLAYEFLGANTAKKLRGSAWNSFEKAQRLRASMSGQVKKNLKPPKRLRMLEA